MELCIRLEFNKQHLIHVSKLHLDPVESVVVLVNGNAHGEQGRESSHVRQE